MGLYLGYLVNFIPAVAAAAVLLYWVANRKRIAAETIGRAEEQALRIHKDAERDADTGKKEALLEAKEHCAPSSGWKPSDRRASARGQLTEREQQLNRWSRRSRTGWRTSIAKRRTCKRADRRWAQKRTSGVGCRRQTSSSSPGSSTSSSGCRASPMKKPKSCS